MIFDLKRHLFESFFTLSLTLSVSTHTTSNYNNFETNRLKSTVFDMPKTAHTLFYKHTKQI